VSDTIRVTGIGDGYDVHVGADSLASLGHRIREIADARRAVVITNDRVADLYLKTASQSLHEAGFDVIEVITPDGERHKTMATLQSVFDAVLPRHVERGTPVVGLGGGVTTDLAGFAAASMLRGMPYIAVPTSLLAMVDASVGGKTGVNHAAGKNLIGAFHPASVVVIDPATLATLPARELQSGLAECVKHDVIRDAAHLTVMEQEAPAYLAGNAEALASLVSHNVRIKAKVVESDPFEQGERAHLNFGHTFGHAFEKATDYAMTHGEAVAVGVRCACRVAEELGMMSPSDRDHVLRVLQACDLPIDGVQATVDDVLPIMLTDKKVRGGRVRFVLPDGLGSATIRDDVDPALVRQVIEEAL
jgi:3-dehydroquinate synthase